MSSVMHESSAQRGNDSRDSAWDVGGYSHQGKQRKVNEDTYLVASFQRSMHVVDSNHPDGKSAMIPEPAAGAVLMVADGMGGHGGGDKASQAAVRVISDYLIHVLPCASAMSATLGDGRTSLHGVRSKLASALLAGDEAIRSAAAEEETVRQMGTTLTLAVITGPLLYVAHVGDSRCYLFRRATLHQLTRDHTVANQVAELGGNVSEAAQLNHILWNCLGGGEGSFPQPEVTKHELRAGDVVLLCSDGLTGELDDSTIAALLAKDEDSRSTCRMLVDEANRRGGRDNITAVVAKPAG